MWNYAKLRSKGNAKSAIVEIIDNCGVCLKDLALAVYDLSGNHVLCGSFDGGPAEARKYELSSCVVDKITLSAANDGKIAVLAYDMRDGDVYLLDTVKEAPVASCLLLCVINVLLGSEYVDRSSNRKQLGTDEPRPFERKALGKEPCAVRDTHGRFVAKRTTDDECDKYDDVPSAPNYDMGEVPMFTLDCLG